MDGQNRDEGRQAEVRHESSQLRDPSRPQPLAEINKSDISKIGSQEPSQKSVSDSDVDSEPGTPEEAFKAATHGTDEAKPGHPGHAEHSREPTGRHADDTWKHQES